MLLLVPLVAMRFTAEAIWAPGDFVAAGLLLFGAGMAYVLATRRTRTTRQQVVGGVLVLDIDGGEKWGTRSIRFGFAGVCRRPLLCRMTSQHTWLPVVAHLFKALQRHRTQRGNRRCRGDLHRPRKVAAIQFNLGVNECELLQLRRRREFRAGRIELGV